MSKEQKSNLPLSSKDDSRIAVLERALDREKRARRQAEDLLEEKSKALYEASLHLKEANGRLQALLSSEGTETTADFVNIIDPYVVMDLSTKVTNMNASAKEFLGFDNDTFTTVLH